MIICRDRVIFGIMPAMAKKTRAEKAADTEQINLRVSTKLLDQLDQIANETGLRRSHLVQMAIFEFIDRRKAQPPQAVDQKPPARR